MKLMEHEMYSCISLLSKLRNDSDYFYFNDQFEFFRTRVVNNVSKNQLIIFKAPQNTSS